jgi:hypothetical protein
MRKTLVLSLLSLVAFTVPAMADVYPGAMCDATSGSITRLFNGPVRNSSTTTTAYVVCPVRRDNNSGTLTASWDLSLVDPLASNSSCTLYSRTSGGGAFAFQTRNSIWSVNSENTLNFTPIAADPDGISLFYCSLPVALGGLYHHINSYRSY